jgi:hypothetical protein
VLYWKSQGTHHLLGSHFTNCSGVNDKGGVIQGVNPKEPIIFLEVILRIVVVLMIREGLFKEYNELYI